MQTIHVDESKIGVLLNIIKNLKDDVIKGYSVSNANDAFYNERKNRLHTLREDIKSGKEAMYDFDTSTDNLLEELRA